MENEINRNLEIQLSEDEFDLYRYLQIIRRRIWILITIFIIVFLSVTIKTFHQTPIYRATTTLIIEPDLPQILDLGEISSFRNSKDFLNTQFEIIKSYKVIKQTVDILGLANNSIEENSIDYVGAFQRMIKVEPIRDSRIVKISIDNSDAEKAVDFVNTLARAFINYNLEDSREASRDAFTWLTERLAILKASVKKSEMDLLKYKEEEDIVSLEKRQIMLEEKISGTNESFTDTQSKRIELETMINEIEQLEDFEMAESLPKILENSLVQTLKQEQSNIELKFAKISKKFKPKHPEIISLQSQLDNIKNRLNKEVEKIVKSIEIELRITKAKENTINRNLDNLKRQSMRLSKQAIQYGVLKREAETNRNMYDVLLHRLKETDISGSTTANNIRVVDEAKIPTKPIKPNKKMNLLIGLILGLAAGVGGCIVTDYFDNSIKDEEDIKLYLKEKLIGLIPKNKESSSNNINNSTEINRSYRELKTFINFHKQDHLLKTILITSAVKGEGKSTSVVFLGKELAQSGLKILLIDADMFNPQMGKHFKIENKIGLRDYYFEDKKNEEIIIKTEFENLSIIQAGLIPPDPSEIIGSNKMKSLIEKVKKDFDIILIDSPPISVALEVAVLGSFVDGIFVLVKANYKSWTVIKKALDTLKSLKGNIIGLILSFAKDSDKYRDYYYYSKK